MKIIRELRVKKNLTQKDLAKEINVSSAALSNWEKGIHDPTHENLSALASFFGVSIEYLHEENKRLSEDRYSIAQDKAAYALILEKNPNIDPNSSVGNLVYRNNFQILILSLLELLSNIDEEQDYAIALLSQLINEMSKMKTSNFSTKRLQYFMDVISFITAATSSSHKDSKGAAIRMVESYIDKYKKVEDTSGGE